MIEVILCIQLIMNLAFAFKIWTMDKISDIQDSQIKYFHARLQSYDIAIEKLQGAKND